MKTLFIAITALIVFAGCTKNNNPTATNGTNTFTVGGITYTYADSNNYLTFYESLVPNEPDTSTANDWHTVYFYITPSNTDTIYPEITAWIDDESGEAGSTFNLQFSKNWGFAAFGAEVPNTTKYPYSLPGSFKVVLTDTTNNILAGTFNGWLYENSAIDSFLINNGKFHFVLH